MLKNKINNIKLFGFHGVYEDEIENGQEFIINIEYIPSYKIYELSWAEEEGPDMTPNEIEWADIENETQYGKKKIYFINYVDVIKELERCFNHQRFNLLESLASYLVYSVTESFNLVYCKISIKKDFSNTKNKINAESVEVDLEFKAPENHYVYDKVTGKRKENKNNEST